MSPWSSSGTRCCGSGASRSAYLSKLRRAFLMRVHPDRFRTRHSQKLMRGQASLVQALSSRMAQGDFVQWQQQQQQRQHQQQLNQQPLEPRLSGSKTSSASYRYVIELRNGSLQEHHIQLGDSVPVEYILDSMQKALEQSGAKSSVPPKPAPTTHFDSNFDSSENMMDMNHNSNNFMDGSSNGKSLFHLHERHNIMTARGRDLPRFLQQTNADWNEIETRKRARLDAQAVASAVRQAYQFQSVDATRLGWSSASVAVLLRRFLDLQTEHCTLIDNVSFYPLRLVFASPTINPTATTPSSSRSTPGTATASALDVYGGIVRLTASSTPLQWLESLQGILNHNDGCLLERVAHHQRLLKERVDMLQQVLGHKIRKGYSCSNPEYHNFIQHMTANLAISSSGSDDSNNALIPSSHGMVGNGPAVDIVVESSQAIRRPKVTPQGHISIGTQLLLPHQHQQQRQESAVSSLIISQTNNSSNNNCSSNVAQLDRVVRDLAPTASSARQEFQARAQTCREYQQQLQSQRGVAKISIDPTVPVDQELERTLKRLLLLPTSSTGAGYGGSTATTARTLSSSSTSLAGHQLRIVARGRHCHLTDDGSIALPVDWQ